MSIAVAPIESPAVADPRMAAFLAPAFGPRLRFNPAAPSARYAARHS